MRDIKNEKRDGLRSAISCAAEIVVSQDFMRNYQTSALVQSDVGSVKALSRTISEIGKAIGDKEMMTAELDVHRNMQGAQKLLSVVPAKWAQDFQSIEREKKVIELFERAINIARPGLAAAAVELRDTLPDKPDFGVDCSASYRRAREHLMSHPQSPRWMALLLFTLARAIGSNARAGFAAHEWGDNTLFWFDIERAWLAGNGVKVAHLLLDADKKFFSKNIAINLGTDMPRRLAEAASIAPGWSLFHPPW